MPDQAHLRDLGTFEHQPFSFDPSSNAEAQEFLSRLNSYGANGSFQHSVTGGDDPHDVWNLVYDQDKIPQRPLGSNFGSMEEHRLFGQTGGGESGAPLEIASRSAGSRDPGQMYDQNMIGDDTIFGKYTHQLNWKPEERDALSTYGPLVVGLVTMGAGMLPALAAGAGAAGAGAAGAAGLSGLSAAEIAAAQSAALAAGEGMGTLGATELATAAGTGALGGGAGAGTSFLDSVGNAATNFGDTVSNAVTNLPQTAADYVTNLPQTIMNRVTDPAWLTRQSINALRDYSSGQQRQREMEARRDYFTRGRG